MKQLSTDVTSGAESFDAAWRRAYELGAHRLTAIAFERAISGTPRQIRKNGEVIAEESVPSDRLLMFLLQRFDSMRYGKLSGLLPVPVPVLSACLGRQSKGPIPPRPRAPRCPVC